MGYELKSKDVSKIVKMWEGSKKTKGIKDARKIGETLNIPRRTIMAFLESKKLTRYSPGSYS